MDVVFAQKRRVRNPVVSGLYYPDEKPELLKLLRSYDLEKTPAQTGFASSNARAKAIIAPHGAWSFSGHLAANSFSSAMGRSACIKKVVVLGPIHDKREKGLFLSNSHSFYTPLGNIRVDRKLTEEFEKTRSSFEINDIPHLSEHSIEILLPFVKYCFPNASIVPILMGQPGAQYIYDLAQGLKSVITPIIDETLIVVSSNLSCNKDENSARILAEEGLRYFKKLNAASLASAILEGSFNACGGALIVSLFESGLVSKTLCGSSAENIVSAVSADNSNVYYGSFSFE